MRVRKKPWWRATRSGVRARCGRRRRSRAATAPRGAWPWPPRSSSLRHRRPRRPRRRSAASRSSSSGWHAQARPTSTRPRPVERVAEQHHRGRGLRPDGAVEHPACARRRDGGRCAGTGVSKRADSPARRTSHASARLKPAPTAGPFTAATVGQRGAQDAQESVVDRSRPQRAFAVVVAARRASRARRRRRPSRTRAARR